MIEVILEIGGNGVGIEFLSTSRNLLFLDYPVTRRSGQVVGELSTTKLHGNHSPARGLANATLAHQLSTVPSSLMKARGPRSYPDLIHPEYGGFAISHFFLAFLSVQLFPAH